MAHRVCPGLLALATAVTLVDGHAYQQFPISRQYSMSPDFIDYPPGQYTQTRLYAYYAGSVGAIIERAALNTPPELLGPGADYFPLYYSEHAENGNYVESNEIAVRHGVCGDPVGKGLNGIGRGHVSTPNTEWEVLGNFESGQEIEMEIVVGAFHFGHLEFRLCDIRDLEDPDGVVTQECFNTYQLNRSPNIADGSPIDPAYPGRYHVDPPCRKNEIEQNISDKIRALGHDVHSFKARYLLPDIECEHCVLQMHYLTSQTCNHVGYAEFNPTSWNSECASDKASWFRGNLDSVEDICGLKGIRNPEANWGYPQEFWACSDISIARGNGPTGTPGRSSPTTSTDSGTAPTPTTSSSEMPYPSPDSTATTTDSGTAPTTTTTTSEMSYPSSDSTTMITDSGTGPTPTTTSSSDLSSLSSESMTMTTDSGSAPTPTTTSSSDMSSGGSDIDTTTTDPTAADNPGKYEHLGCFLDSKMDRVLEEESKIDSSEMTSELCSEHCSARGAVYMATQFGRECWCSHNDLLDYDKHGEGGACDSPCTGDEMEICGGWDSFDLYKLDMRNAVEDRPEYLGCFADDTADRVMTDWIETEDMTSAICSDYCSDMDALYYATQYGTECWCGTSDNAADYERHGEGICDTACAGDEGLICGGYEAYSLFKYLRRQ